jgi:hypothetical protein
MRDVASELRGRGVATRIGKGVAYGGEEVVFNSRFMTALFEPKARINSLFITHVDDASKERDLRSTFSRFNSFVCLSPQDADFVRALKPDRAGVVGIELPARGQRVVPIRLAYFSARYPDGRKNEQWIVDYFRDKTAEQRGAFVFCFLGWGWESFCAELAAIEMNYELYRYSRFTPGEYDLYREVLPRTDALIYLGFDGGAMSVYDAIAAGVDVVASDTSYHRGLGDGVLLFENREQFYAHLDRFLAQHGARAAALQQRSITAYVDRLLSHWSSLLTNETAPHGAECDDERRAIDRELATLKAFRTNYRRMTVTRVRSAVIRWLQTRFIRF